MLLKFDLTPNQTFTQKNIINVNRKQSNKGKECCHLLSPLFRLTIQCASKRLKNGRCECQMSVKHLSTADVEKNTS